MAGTSQLPPIETIVEKPIVIEPKIIQQPTPPTPIKVKTYKYYVTNGSNTMGQYSSGFTNSFGYYDADGVERIGKSLTPGETTTVCAQQGTIRSGGPNWTVTQGEECNPQPITTPVNTIISGGGSGGGGGRAMDDYRNYNGGIIDRPNVQEYT